MAGTGAVFMLLKNEGKEADRLVGGRTDVAKVVEIHETVMDGDVMKMQMLPDGLEIPARRRGVAQAGQLPRHAHRHGARPEGRRHVHARVAV